MIPNLSFVEHWKLLTPENIHARKLWPWGYSIQKIIAASEPKPRETDHLVIASDYGGNHAKASHLIYCYLVVKGGGREWQSAILAARRDHMRDRGVMSYKRLNDPVRQRALVSFLQAAANLDGHLVAIAVDKRQRSLAIMDEAAADNIAAAFRLKSFWNARALEAMLRKTQFAAILLSMWALRVSTINWITDADEFVANDLRHDDALQATARYCAFYLPGPQGILRLNTTTQDEDGINFEDLCSIPDLAAGMLSDVSTKLSQVGSWTDRIEKVVHGELTPKVSILADWFWDTDMRLRKTLISIDVLEKQLSVRRITMRNGDSGEVPDPDFALGLSGSEGSVWRSRDSSKPRVDGVSLTHRLMVLAESAEGCRITRQAASSALSEEFRQAGK